MKKFLLLFVFSAIALSTVQSQSISGEYLRKRETASGEIFALTLVLKADQTFTFHYYQTFLALNPEQNIYGKGTWSVDKNIVSFSTDEKTDLDKIHTLNFNNTKARYITKSPRDTSDKVVKTAVSFYKSDIPWMKGSELSKIE